MSCMPRPSRLALRTASFPMRSGAAVTTSPRRREFGCRRSCARSKKLAFYAAWIESESPDVAVSYRSLIQATRRLAGSQMHAAWEAAAPHTDAEMNMAGIDYGELVSLETAYLGSVREHLAPWWTHLWRFVTGKQG